MQELVLTETWRDRVGNLVVAAREKRLLTMVVGAAVALSLILWSRPSPARIAPPARSVVPAAATPSVASVIVHVAGAVRAPGLYEFPSGARIADAIETAGGALRAADLDSLNLAELLSDGTQINVPTHAKRSSPIATSTAATADGIVHLNSADATALETVPGIGPVTAAAILQHRDEVGAFTSVDELLDVDGIGPATLEAIRPYIAL